MVVQSPAALAVPVSSSMPASKLLRSRESLFFIQSVDEVAQAVLGAVVEVALLLGLDDVHDPLTVSKRSTGTCSQLLAFSPSNFRLKEIQMSEYDAATYERFSGAVRRQVHSLRIILDNLQVINMNEPRK